MTTHIKVAECKVDGKHHSLYAIENRRVYSALRGVKYDKGTLKLVGNYTWLSIATH
jgi:hypothetical protein